MSGKSGLGQISNDKSVNVSTRGLKDVLSVEIIDANGNQTTNFSSALGIPAYDYIAIIYPTATTEIYTFKTDGAGGTTVATVTLVYTDSTKSALSTVTKT